MKKFWKSKDHLENNDHFRQMAKREFPDDRFDRLDQDDSEISRRNFFKLMGSSMMLAGLSSGCSHIRKPEKRIYPYVKMPENLIPGNPIYYATSHQLGEDVSGLLVENHEGRPTKIEGNPLYPHNKGASNVFHQASVLDLYDPDRFKTVLSEGKPSDFTAVNRWIDRLDLEKNQGEGVAFLLGYSVSPTLYRLLDQVLNRYPKLRVYRYEPVNNDSIYRGVYDISGRWALPVIDYTRADVVVSLDADFLGLESGSMRANREFMTQKTVDGGKSNRLYQFENTFSVTGSVADHRFKVKRSEIDLIAYSILRQFYKKGVFRTNKFLISLLEKSLISSANIIRDDKTYKNIPVVADDLSQNISRAVVVAGASASPMVHSLVYYINHLIKAPVRYYTHPFVQKKYVQTSSATSVNRLVDEVKNRRVNHLVVLDGDPVYNIPQEVGFEKLFKGLNTLYLANHPNETSSHANVVVPKSHYLETWSDQVSVDGCVSLVQPLIRPLNESVSDLEFLSLFLKEKRNPVDLIKETHPSIDWKRSLHDGMAYYLKGLQNASNPSNIDLFASRNARKFITANGKLEVSFDPDYSVYDGRFVNNAWLQELPDPVTKITWDNVILISYYLAKKKKLKSYDRIRLAVGGRSVEGVVWVLPGQTDLSISLKWGYGQKVTGKVGRGTGFSAYILSRLSSTGVIQGDVSLISLGKTEKIASVQDHWMVEDEIFTGGPSSNKQNHRPLYRQTDLDEYKKNPSFAKDLVEVPHLKEYHDRLKKNKKDHPMYAENMSIFNEVKYSSEYQWGMAIDLNTCTGCNACTIACQSENNIPVVGKEMVLKGRELHWIRIDRYFEGDPEDPQMVAQPVNCFHCEQAPCEQVCPVAATVHSEEGLNDMVYNRCIGTRFCSNNCPIKVRRFNYFDYHQRSPHAQKKISSHLFELFKEPKETLQMQFNPDVTVRMRGVMEKCTYCVQRINQVRVKARNEDRKIKDGEIKMACEQACPSGSIVFGNISDERSKVSQMKLKDRNYHMLAELNIKPRTSYLAAIKNPNKRII